MRTVPEIAQATTGTERHRADQEKARKGTQHPESPSRAEPEVEVSASFDGNVRAMQIGEVLSWERSFTVEDVRAFAQLTGDHGRHHEAPDAQGRLLVHGLLTASLPTKLGGDMSFVAREMRFEFLRPVYTGELIRCTVTVIKLEKAADRTRLELTLACVNPDGREVLRGGCVGVVFG